MGISTVQSYLGAQVFEIIGLNEDLVNKYFTSTPVSLGGLNIKDIESRVVSLYQKACKKRYNALHYT